MFRHRCEEKTDLARPARARKIVTLTVISDIDIAVKMNRRRSIRDSASEFSVPVVSSNNRALPSQMAFGAFPNNGTLVSKLCLLYLYRCVFL